MSVTISAVKHRPYQKGDFLVRLGDGAGYHLIGQLGYDPNDTCGVYIDPVEVLERIQRLVEGNTCLDAAMWRWVAGIAVVANEAYRTGEKIALT